MNKDHLRDKGLMTKLYEESGRDVELYAVKLETVVDELQSEVEQLQAEINPIIWRNEWIKEKQKAERLEKENKAHIKMLNWIKDNDTNWNIDFEREITNHFKELESEEKE
jgi:hypothetical protein